MTHITCRLTAKNRDQLRNTTLGNRVWAPFIFLSYSTVQPVNYCCTESSAESAELRVEFRLDADVVSDRRQCVARLHCRVHAARLVPSTSRRVHVVSSPHSSARTEDVSSCPRRVHVTSCRVHTARLVPSTSRRVHVSSCPRHVASTQLSSYRGCRVVSTSCPRRVASTQLGSYRARLVVSTSRRVHAARLVPRMSCRCQDATAQSPSRRGSLFCTVKMMFAVSKTVLLQYSSC